MCPSRVHLEIKDKIAHTCKMRLCVGVGVKYFMPVWRGARDKAPGCVVWSANC
jgi:hypothetical protein